MLPEQNIDTLKAYVLVKVETAGAVLSLSMSYASSANTSGFHSTLAEAQNQQVIEKLSGKTYNIYCLDIPVSTIKKDY
jgi:hypothetical protein